MRKSVITNLLVTSACLAIAEPALAQQAAVAPAQAADEALPGNEDIIVMARRRAESIQTVPVAVTAVSGIALEKQNVTSMLDLPRVAPGLSASPSGGASRNLPLYNIRGQQQGEFQPSSDPSVGIYWGDVVVQRAYGSDFNIFDLGQIEVVKGPQGTLFGRNTTGGNIVFRPNLPTDRFEAGATIQTGSYSLASAQAYVNVPLADGIALRVAGNYRYQQGYIRNTFATPSDYKYSFPGPLNQISIVDPPLPGIPGARYQGTKGGAIRASLRIDSGPFESVTTATHIEANMGGSGYRLFAIQPGSAAATLISLTNPTELAQIQALPTYQTRDNDMDYTKVDYSDQLANTTSFEVSDEITVKNIIGYHKYKGSNFENIDGSSIPILEYGQAVKGWEFSDEFQILGDMPGLNWIAGAYYYKEKGNNQSYTPNLLGFFVRGLQTPFYGYQEARNESKSLFASATKTLDFLAPGLSLTMGGRYTWDDRAIIFGTKHNLGLPTQRCALEPSSATYTKFNAKFDAAACTMSESTNFGQFTYTASLDWKIARDKLLYAVTRKGYRSGGFGSRGTAPAPDPSGRTAYDPFQPENVRDVEVGFKADWDLGGGARLQTNLSAYYQWYKNIQRLITFSPCATCVQQTVVFNAATAHIYGGEFEASLHVGKWLELNGSVALVRPVYDRFEFPLGSGVDWASQATFGGAIRNQYNANAVVTLPVPEEIADTKVSVYWHKRSSFYNQDNLTSEVQAKVPGYSLTNARIDFNSIGGSNFDLAFAVNNLFDKKYLINKYSLYTQMGFVSGAAGAPRQWTGTMRFRF
ncbi:MULTISPECIES: TonB-dependent receptor [unclassified Sphingobium]|uniref:TonB-dependent receptor n=1 Tax=unclassified Sphingobium TaxID=2611147 RepID=UPI000D1690F7|nr:MULTISPECIES: TonB-dependent receptor plug domain-containing protein [unclassified Sphingobium]MBG6119930.1 iron complex outermembrane receptor protein [Sphingobium sp. JAI105]PSO11903.1 hypothetical protein C7E20_10675 [Sphingobium sp. AEW4]TWC96523.1 iron complex outermembrane receptor protein [Sphingobium sp. AEW010]TWD16408.1 iron complex outermembrane receptor protein [Sphingobium sp. AEW013]TWD19279.1 iron complex outermembrane receptor protein [Sphingobium sp. AEW001]